MKRQTTEIAAAAISGIDGIPTQQRLRPASLLSTCRLNQWGETIAHVTRTQDYACGTGRGYGQTRIRLRRCVNCAKFSVTLIGSMSSAADVLEEMLDAVAAYEIHSGPQHISWEQPGFEDAPRPKRRTSGSGREATA